MKSSTKLRAALQEAKSHLRDSIGEHTLNRSAVPQSETFPQQKNARSKLNTMLGRHTVETQPLSLFQRAGVPQRPTYDLISNRILGSDISEHRTFLDERSDYADHVASRLKILEEKLHTPSENLLEQDEDFSFIGMEHDGQPVWSHVLQEQRGQMTYPLRPAGQTEQPKIVVPHTSLSNAAPQWPKRLMWSNERSFKHWFVGQENFEATRRCEAVIDVPVNRINPLFISAESQSGCSLLLHATGQAMLRRGEGHVLALSASDAVSVDVLSSSWNDALHGAVALIVDDIHEFSEHEIWSHQLGVLLDQALNLGLQVIVGGRISPETMRPSRLKEVLRSASMCSLSSPSSATLMAFARWKSVAKKVFIADHHLAQIARMPPIGYRNVEQRLELLRLAFARGEVLLDHDDVSRILDPRDTSIEQGVEQRRVEDVASSIVGEVLDSVYSSIEPGGIDLHTKIQPWGEDDYSPPQWEQGSLASMQTKQFEQGVAETIAKVTPGKPSVLDVHEREKYLISHYDTMKRKDVERAVEILVDVDEHIDKTLNRGSLNSNAVDQLHELEEQMILLAKRAVDADIDSLIGIADELRHLEERLVALDPDAAPLPAFEEEEANPPRHSHLRKLGREKKTSSNEESTLDSFEPAGEWDIDADQVEMNELLSHSRKATRRITTQSQVPQNQDKPAVKQAQATTSTTSSQNAKTVVGLARLRPKTVLLGEEE